MEVMLEELGQRRGKCVSLEATSNSQAVASYKATRLHADKYSNIELARPQRLQGCMLQEYPPQLVGPQGAGRVAF